MKVIKVVLSLQEDEGDDGELAKIVDKWLVNPGQDLVMMDDEVEVVVAKVETLQDELDRATMAEKERIRRLAINAGLNDFAVQLRDENL